MPQEQLVDELFKEIDKYARTKRIDVDSADGVLMLNAYLVEDEPQASMVRARSFLADLVEPEMKVRRTGKRQAPVAA